MTDLLRSYAYELELGQNGDIYDSATGDPFKTETFKLMKYGDRKAAFEFAHDLVISLVDTMPMLVEGENPPSFMAAYKALPHAAFFVSRYTLHYLNRMRVDNDNRPGDMVVVEKSRTMTVNYAALSEEEREDEYDKVAFHTDKLIDLDTIPVIIDDTRITGTAEKKFLGIFHDEKPSLIILGYIATFSRELASSNPDIENVLNGTQTIEPTDLLPIINAGHFDLNIRALNMILSTEPHKLISFIEKCPRGLVQRMFQGAIESGPEFVSHHKMGMTCLQLAVEGL